MNEITMAEKINNDTDMFNAIDELYDSDNSNNDEDDTVKSKEHKRLLNDISHISGIGAKRPALRSGPSLQVAEHLWSFKSGAGKQDKLELHDLLDSIPQSSSFGSIRKKIQKLEKSKDILDTPLAKHQVEKIQRAIIYDTNAKEVSKWTGTVIQNREAESLKFPLNAYEEPKPTTKTVSLNFKPKNSLEKEIAAVLKGSSSLLERNNKELTEEEEKALQAVDLQEAMERRKELQKMRALQSYYEMKCRRTKKIKSKKFRRIQRKAEQKNEAKNAKELTEADKSDMANEIETQRAMERAHLRHRNTSKWAKKIMTKDNKSLQDKQSLHDQLTLSRKLTNQKTYEDESENEVEALDEIADFSLLKKSSDNKDNPWLLGGETEKSKGSRKEGDKGDDEWNSDDEEKILAKEKPRNETRNNKENSEFNEPDIDIEAGVEYENIVDVKEETSHKTVFDSEVKEAVDDSKSNSVVSNRIDQNSFIVVESKALDVSNFIVQDSDVNFGSSVSQKSLIKEAFANDQVAEEFEMEKKKVREQRMPKTVDLTLPGWGEWAGAGLDNEKVLKRKRKKFVKVGKKQAPSKDERLKYVIINEERNKKFAANQVSDVPFPYSSKAQFERSIRQPVGKTWNTPSLTAKLSQPRISTLMGTIIEPIKKVNEVKKATVNHSNKEFISNAKKGRRS